LNHAARFRMFSFAPPAIRRLNEAGLAVVVVSNQSGVARGYFPESLVLEVNELMKSALAKEGARLDGVYYCPHSSADGCDCRKPKPGMMQMITERFEIDPDHTPVVGDSLREQLTRDQQDEEGAIDLYRKIVSKAVQEQDVVTEQLFKGILGDEEDHNDTFQTLLEEV
jgi:histidinol-phosphate phosphatase family protein